VEGWHWRLVIAPILVVLLLVLSAWRGHHARKRAKRRAGILSSVKRRSDN